MKRFFIIDRFEGVYAVCEHDGQMVEIPKARLPRGVRAGDALVCEDGVYRVDVQETARRREQAQKLIDELWK